MAVVAAAKLAPGDETAAAGTCAPFEPPDGISLGDEEERVGCACAAADVRDVKPEKEVCSEVELSGALVLLPL